MQRKEVALLEFSVRKGIAPLATAYLEATASTNKKIVENYKFSKYTWSIQDNDLVEKVLKIEADVFAFSCYVWNSGLVRRILPAIISRGAHIILGGPQVMNKGETYIPAALENIVVCNGEGEFTFSDYLLQILEEKPDFSMVKGLSFYRDGQFFSTPKHDRIRDLDKIPSPFLDGFIDAAKYSFAVYESNRGCDLPPAISSSLS